MPDIVLINPRLEISNYGLEHALPFLGRKAVAPVASLPLLAALTPAAYQVTVIDENVEPIDFERCAAADIVGITGMVVHRLEILVELKRHGCFTVVGGPWITVWEEDFGEFANSSAKRRKPGRSSSPIGTPAPGKGATSKPSAPICREFRCRGSTS